MKILFEIIGIIVLIIIVLIVLFLIGLAIVPTVPNKYISKVETGGIIEEKYLKMGSYARISCYFRVKWNRSIA